jgi:isoleucyl-tRNA synthetase
MLAPILAFTTEEIWAAMPHRSGSERGSVLFNALPEPVAERAFTPQREVMWDKLLRLRTDVNKALELARAGKVIGKPLDAEVTLYVGDAASAAFGEIAGHDLKVLFIVSEVDVVMGGGEGYAGIEFPGVTVSVRPSAELKCVRCWAHDKGVGKSAEHPELCPRCLDVVSST